MTSLSCHFTDNSGNLIWTGEEYLAWLEENGWKVVFHREMAARIAMMYTECERDSKVSTN